MQINRGKKKEQSMRCLLLKNDIKLISTLTVQHTNLHIYFYGLFICSTNIITAYQSIMTFLNTETSVKMNAMPNEELDHTLNNRRHQLHSIHQSALISSLKRREPANKQIDTLVQASLEKGKLPVNM